MGGGGGQTPFIRGIDELLKAAKDELRDKTAPERKNVFISFAYEDINDVNLLRGQAKNDNMDLEFNDWSVRAPFNSEKADYIKTKISERINASSVTVVYVSENTPESSWVKWEVQKSLELGKKVLAVYSGKTQPPLPTIITGNKIKAVPWANLAAELEKI